MPLVPLRPVLDATVKYGYAQGPSTSTPWPRPRRSSPYTRCSAPRPFCRGRPGQRLHGRPGGLCKRHPGGQEEGARNIAEAVKKFAEQSPIPVVLHLDHGKNFDSCVAAIEGGYTSVMIDGSHLPYDENVALTKKVVEYAHKHDVTVEGELGVLAGVEDEVRPNTIPTPVPRTWRIS